MKSKKLLQHFTPNRTTVEHQSTAIYTFKKEGSKIAILWLPKVILVDRALKDNCSKGHLSEENLFVELKSAENNVNVF